RSTRVSRAIRSSTACTSAKRCAPATSSMVPPPSKSPEPPRSSTPPTHFRSKTTAAWKFSGTQPERWGVSGGASIAPPDDNQTHALLLSNLMIDTITVEIIRAALNAAAGRMRITLIKTAYNHIISESLDFGCAIFDHDVQMIAQGIGLPVFQGHLGFPIEATIADRGIEAFREGDIFIHNDPYTGNGNHLNDVAMTMPVFCEGKLTGFVAVKAHWSDVGGPVPSSMQLGSREFRQEGLRFVSVRLYSRGELNEEVMRVIRGNIRTESGTLKDIQAMIAVCRAGEASFHDILARYGRDTVLAATRTYMEQSERRTRAALAAIPPCTWRAGGHFSNHGIT